MPRAKWRRFSPSLIFASTCYVAHEAQKPKQDICLLNKVTALLNATWDYEGLQNQSYLERIMTNFVTGNVMSADAAIIWSNAGLLSVGPSWTNFSEISIKILHSRKWIWKYCPRNGSCSGAYELTVCGSCIFSPPVLVCHRWYAARLALTH